jgi:hypothetical protein
MCAERSARARAVCEHRLGALDAHQDLLGCAPVRPGWPGVRPLPTAHCPLRVVHCPPRVVHSPPRIVHSAQCTLHTRVRVRVRVPGRSPLRCPRGSLPLLLLIDPSDERSLQYPLWHRLRPSPRSPVPSPQSPSPPVPQSRPLRPNHTHSHPVPPGSAQSSPVPPNPDRPRPPIGPGMKPPLKMARTNSLVVQRLEDTGPRWACLPSHPPTIQRPASDGQPQPKPQTPNTNHQPPPANHQPPTTNPQPPAGNPQFCPSNFGHKLTRATSAPTPSKGM